MRAGAEQRCPRGASVITSRQPHADSRSSSFHNLMETDVQRGTGVSGAAADDNGTQFADLCDDSDALSAARGTIEGVALGGMIWAVILRLLL